MSQARLQWSLGDAFRIEEKIPDGGSSRLHLATDTARGRKGVAMRLLRAITRARSATRYRPALASLPE